MSSWSCQEKAKKENLSPAEAKSIAKDAFIYGYALVMNYKTMYDFTLDKNSPRFKGDFNQLVSEARVSTPDDNTIVTVNSDTPYSWGWMDISEAPIIISVPEMEEDRFYHLQLVDMYTHNFAYIGSLTTGTGAGKFMVAASDWNGGVPEGINDVIRCETDYCFVLGRTQLFNPSDLKRVKEIQSQYKVQTLSAYKGLPEKKSTFFDIPAWNEGDQFTAALFKYLDPILNNLTPVDNDKSIFERFRKIGLGTGSYDINSFDADTKKAIEAGANEGYEAIVDFIKTNTTPMGSAYIFGTRSFLEQSAKANFNIDKPDMLRSVGAQAGLYGNSGSEAVYPTYYNDSEGQPLDASTNNYTFTFEAGSMPPVKAFWSLTMYDGKTQLLVHNPIDRYLLNSSMMDSFVKNDDGSITLYLQKSSPGASLEANWLPAPDGPMLPTLRLYGPEQRVLDGEWEVPKIVRAN